MHLVKIEDQIINIELITNIATYHVERSNPSISIYFSGSENRSTITGRENIDTFLDYLDAYIIDARIANEKKASRKDTKLVDEIEMPVDITEAIKNMKTGFGMFSPQQ